MDNTELLNRRGSWGNWFEFLFAYLGSVIGYGNIWRFPYVCYRNGGGAFLVPFVISLVVCGLPVTLLEMSFSQYSNYSLGRVWEVSPFFKGVGICQLLLVLTVSTYYTMIMAWTLYYLVNSFYVPIPWSSCDNEWNTERCTLSVNNTSSLTVNGTFDENSLLSSASFNMTRVSPSEEFWL